MLATDNVVLVGVFVGHNKSYCRRQAVCPFIYPSIHSSVCPSVWPGLPASYVCRQAAIQPVIQAFTQLGSQS